MQPAGVERTHLVDAGEVPEVEHVVEPRRRRREPVADEVVELERDVRELLAQDVLDLLGGQLDQVAGQDGLEGVDMRDEITCGVLWRCETYCPSWILSAWLFYDASSLPLPPRRRRRALAHLVDGPQVLVGGELDLKHAEQRHEARVHRVPRAARRAHPADHLHVLHVLPAELLPAVVEAPALDKELEQRDGLLCAVEVHSWHVEVVDKHDQPLAHRGAVGILRGKDARKEGGGHVRPVRIIGCRQAARCPSRALVSVRIGSTPG